MSGYRDEVKPASNAGKVVVLLLGLTILAVLFGVRLFNSAEVGEIAQGVVETIAPTEIAPTPTQEEEPVVIVEPTATIDNTLAPAILAAIISPSENGDQLNLSGSADIACGELIGFLDGLEVGVTAPTASGTWALSVPAPAVGEYDAVIKCVTSESEFSAAPVKIKVPENPTLEIEEVATPIVTETVEATPIVTETVDTEPTVVTDTVEVAPTAITETVIIEETPIPPASVDQPDYTYANDMEDWVGGPLLVRGSAESNSEVELIFDNGFQPATIVTPTVNAEGRYAARVVLTNPGEYLVIVQYAGSQAQPTDSIVVPSDVNFGGSGNCVGTVPPFGTIEGDVYIVNSCEYFSLIANRLGITYRDLLAVNGDILNPNNLRAGDRIQIPPLP